MRRIEHGFEHGAVEQKLICRQQCKPGEHARNRFELNKRKAEQPRNADGLQNAPLRVNARQNVPAGGEKRAYAKQRQIPRCKMAVRCALTNAGALTKRSAVEQSNGKEEDRSDGVRNRKPDVRRVLEPRGNDFHLAEVVCHRHHQHREPAETIDCAVALQFHTVPASPYSFLYAYLYS
ncbi:hypothetical protein SDC9_200248 [bioreactor metagenome]|uniref:Uncharacterized protein n=1 Tax=bioreactor metagenome TaxID=1076179 RepID=A0A645IND8_9ZZZZ